MGIESKRINWCQCQNGDISSQLDSFKTRPCLSTGIFLLFLSNFDWDFRFQFNIFEKYSSRVCFEMKRGEFFWKQQQKSMLTNGSVCACGTSQRDGNAGGTAHGRKCCAKLSIDNEFRYRSNRRQRQSQWRRVSPTIPHRFFFPLPTRHLHNSSIHKIVTIIRSNLIVFKHGWFIMANKLLLESGKMTWSNSISRWVATASSNERSDEWRNRIANNR